MDAKKHGSIGGKREPQKQQSLPRKTRPVQVDMYVRVCVIGFGVSTVSDSVRFVCYGPARRRCHVWASLQALGGCLGASVSVVYALRGSLSRPRWVPRPCVWWHRLRCDVSVVCWLDAYTAAWLGIAVCGSCSHVGLRWWAGVCRVCVPLVVSCSSSCLLVHS